MKRVSILVSVLLATLVACGSSSKEKAEHNNPDIQFARESIAYHHIALHALELGLPRINSPDVKKLAEEIKTAQEETLKALEKLEHEWHVQDTALTPARLSADKTRELEHAEGTEFDVAFLRTMIENHEKALKATNKVIREGKSKEAKKLAHELHRAQEREIEEMEKELVGA